MERKEFEKALDRYADVIESIRMSAHHLHDSVNQTYGKGLPYGYHLDMVATAVSDHGHLVCVSEHDVVPIIFGAYFHDSIEDARMSYNDVLKQAHRFMDEQQALMATETVYAQTNEKGRTRAERANEKYYQGIRNTPYAPFIKLCDRLSNVAFSCSEENTDGQRMKELYKKEMSHFLESIDAHSDDPRFGVPQEVVFEMAECLIVNMEHEEEKWWKRNS